MSVRRADAGDLSEILRIDPRADAGDAERIEYLTRAVDRDVCLVATDDDAAYGFVVLKRRRFFGRDFIDLLMVAERHRRRGLGSMLMSAAVDAASTQEVFTSTRFRRSRARLCRPRRCGGVARPACPGAPTFKP